MNTKEKLAKMLMKKAGYTYDPNDPGSTVKQVINRCVFEGIRKGAITKEEMIKYLNNVIKNLEVDL